MEHVYFAPPPKVQCHYKRGVKVRTVVDYKQTMLLGTAVETAFSKFMQVQVRQNLSREVGGRYKIPPLAMESPIISYWEMEKQVFLKCSGNSTMLQ